MIKTQTKWTRRVITLSVGTALVVILIASCLTLTAWALFLQTVTALTRETPVAEVIMGPIQTDENGEYMEIQFTEYPRPTALTEIFRSGDTTEPGEKGIPQTYRIYGDTVAIRGPLIKLHALPLILNFSNTYKLSLIEGEYRRPGAASEGTEIPINGGFDPYWWDFNSREAQFPYSVLIDRFTISGDEEPGFYGTGKKRYEIVMTMDAITWNFIENLES
jgi:hypothetical protein